MSVHEKDQVCSTLVAKILSGQRLSAADKEHLARCAGCVREVVRGLDQARQRNAPSHGSNGTGGEPDGADCAPEVREALAHGRRAFAREFGLS